MDVEDITVTRMLDLKVPSQVIGEVVARENITRFNNREKVYVQLQLENNPIIMLTDTLPMKVKNLQVGRKYNFKKYNLYYNAEHTGTHSSSFCFDRGQEFSEVGSTGKIRYYKAEDLC